MNFREGHWNICFHRQNTRNKGAVENKNGQSKRSDVLMFLLSFCRMYSSLSRWWFQRFLELLPKKLVEMIRFQFDKTTIFLFDLG